LQRVPTIIPVLLYRDVLSVMDRCLRSRHYVNVVIAGKRPAPQWLTMDVAVKHCTAAIGIWQWASNDENGGQTW
jgi:xylulose-5-phosphate/fructose-6-phosphate phosphoketolase